MAGATIDGRINFEDGMLLTGRRKEEHLPLSFSTWALSSFPVLQVSPSICWA
jgi:hypothetical protein